MNSSNTLFSLTTLNCTYCSPGVETALRGYEASRLHRTEVIYARSARQGYSLYKPDSETTVAKMVAQLSEDEFQVWLYSYQPSIVRAGIPLS